MTVTSTLWTVGYFAVGGLTAGIAAANADPSDDLGDVGCLLILLWPVFLPFILGYAIVKRLRQ